MTHCNEHSQVKMVAQRSILWDSVLFVPVCDFIPGVGRVLHGKGADKRGLRAAWDG